MNANVPAQQQQKPKSNVPVVAGANVAALIPQSLEEAFRVANAIAASSLAPRGLDRPEQILVAIMAGAELGLAPFQSLQSFAVVNGRPTLWGDGLMAVARSGGVRVKEWMEGADEAAVAHCEVTRPDGEVIPRTFSVADAKKAGLWGKQGPWQQYPQRMLQMRARAWALRDGCADMLRGFQVREEAEDFETVRNVTPRKGTGMRARLEARAHEVDEPNGGFDPDFVDAHTADFTDVTDELSEPDAPPADDPAPDVNDDFPGDRPSAAFDVRAWAGETSRGLDDFPTLEALNTFTDDAENIARFETLMAEAPALAKSLEAAITGRRKALADRARG
jgi:hypothetical protein